jgi:integrase
MRNLSRSRLGHWHDTELSPASSRARVLPQANAYAMIRRRAAGAGIATKLGNHGFRATGITAYLKNGGARSKKAAAMANHASTRTTQLYDRQRDEVSLDEVERITI